MLEGPYSAFARPPLLVLVEEVKVGSEDLPSVFGPLASPVLVEHLTAEPEDPKKYAVVLKIPHGSEFPHDDGLPRLCNQDGNPQRSRSNLCGMCPSVRTERIGTGERMHSQAADSDNGRSRGGHVGICVGGYNVFGLRRSPNLVSQCSLSRYQRKWFLCTRRRNLVER